MSRLDKAQAIVNIADTATRLVLAVLEARREAKKKRKARRATARGPS